MNNPVIEIIKGDITKYSVDIIVNAANSALSGGGGVDRAIHRAAGAELLKECRTLKRCEAGNAVITKGYLLPCKYVIHAVGPVWSGGNCNETELLASCYKKSLDLTDQAGAVSISFPSISTGAYRFPLEKAAPIAINTIIKETTQSTTIKEIYIMCFDTKTQNAYKKALQSIRER